MISDTAKIDDDEVRPRARRQCQAAPPILGVEHVYVRALHRCVDEAADMAVVFDENDGNGGFGHR
jgi:hypothetical protein